jgi:hypothetical protein
MAAVLLSIIAGAAVIPARAIEANRWFTSKDHPKTAMQVAERGPIDYRIDVAPDGTALRCTTPGQSDLETKVCALIMKGARFTPASDADGRPAFAVHEGVSSFLIPGGPRRPDRARLAVTVERLPHDAASPAYASVAFLVDAAGAISQCAAVAAGGGRRFQSVPALAPQACEAAARGYRARPARDAAGEAVASVQSLTVRFEVR